jgi:hypothetical protein
MMNNQDKSLKNFSFEEQNEIRVANKRIPSGRVYMSVCQKKVERNRKHI